jgi:hypothetical protein
MTYVTKEPQRPGVVDVHNDRILPDVKKGKAHGEIHTGNGQFPNRDLHGKQFGKM